MTPLSTNPPMTLPKHPDLFKQYVRCSYGLHSTLYGYNIRFTDYKFYKAPPSQKKNNAYTYSAPLSQKNNAYTILGLMRAENRT